jgi:hypothetical protein
MMIPRKQALVLAATAVAALQAMRAEAQQPGAPAAPPAPNEQPQPAAPAPPAPPPAGAPGAAAPAAPAPAPAAAPPAAPPPATPPTERAPGSTVVVGTNKEVFVLPPPPSGVAAGAARRKPLQTTVGIKPSLPDLGPLADWVSTSNRDRPPPVPRRWTFGLKGWLRAPLRISNGPRNDGTGGAELHSPPRVVDASAEQWTYTGLVPMPQAALHVNVENARVSGNVLLVANGFFDSGYDNPTKTGGVEQAYVTLRFPETFGSAGGLAWTVGGFANRYGTAGPRNESSGYYGTYLFGRTHVMGEALTADIDLSEDLELILEHGFGVKLEVVPWTSRANVNAPPAVPYLPDQGPVPQGTNLIHHAHGALVVADWFRVAGHYLLSWSPNDMASVSGQKAQSASLTVVGGEVHVDHPVAGNGFVGYSHVNATRVLPLADGVELLHSINGYGLKQNYFGGPVDPAYFAAPQPATLPAANDTGKIDTVQFQYLIKLAPILGYSLDGPDLGLAFFGMYNRIDSTLVKGDRMKFGAEIGGAPLKNFWITVRGDRVMRDGTKSEEAFSALTPQLVVHTRWIAREYVTLSYTHYFVGENVRPSKPYEYLTEPDPDMLVLSAALAF